MDFLVDKERMNSIIEFWQKKYADAEKELECSINLRKQIQNDLLKSDRLNDNLEAENARLKEEIEIRDNLSEKFRKEALSWANIANEYQKDKTKLEQTLQEIKAIAEYEIKELTNSAINGGRYLEILDLITKAEEE